MQLSHIRRVVAKIRRVICFPRNDKLRDVKISKIDDTFYVVTLNLSKAFYAAMGIPMKTERELPLPEWLICKSNERPIFIQ